MAHLPVLKSLEVQNYSLYPGRDGTSANFDFTENLTVTIGANGLGKTTLVELLFRMLTGPVDIPGADAESLGRASLVVRDLPARSRRYFALRVEDGAERAQATLTFQLDQTRVSVTRRMANLELVTASFESTNLSAEDDYQDAIRTSANLGSFSDWILLLRYVVFYSDSRRPLIWDSDAQRQVLRPLFLQPADSNEWVAQEQRILQLDSERRNLSAVIFRQSEYLRQQTVRNRDADGSRSKIEKLEHDAQNLREALGPITDQLSELAQLRDESRLRFLQDESTLEALRREYERAKFTSVVNRLPSASPSLKYALLRLESEGICFSCGTAAPELQQAVREREAAKHCPVCGSDLEAEPDLSLDEKRLRSAQDRLDETRESANAAERQMQSARADYDSLVATSSSQRSHLSDLETQLSELYAQLPDHDDELDRRARTIQGFKDTLTRADAELEERRARFQNVVRQGSERLVAQAGALRSAFSRFADAFLVERSELSWAPKNERVGQSGITIPLPHYALQMTGNAVTGVTLRQDEDAVSESQREFIDLAFRMALISVGTTDGAGTLIIDSPDSSLDAVFEDKAAAVLASFAESAAQTKVLITTNLSSGDFVPSLAGKYKEASSQLPGMIDLFDLAAPTAATQRLNEQYRAARAGILRRAGYEV